MKRVAILQSNYIPWKGYFEIIHGVDTFIFYDDVQYTTRDWRNRNRIKTDTGERWLTIPVGADEHRLRCEVALPDASWAADHWRRIRGAYHQAPYFADYRAYFEELYLGRQWRTLSELNQAFISGIARDLLGITIEFQDSRAFALTRRKGDRVLELLSKAGADLYVSGRAARRYITDEAFDAAGINVEWKDYGGYPAYLQAGQSCSHSVTILDLLFHTGPEASWHIWGWRDGQHVVAA